MLKINGKYSKHGKHNFGKVFQTKVAQYFTDQLKGADADFDMPLQKPMRKGRDWNRSENRTEKYSTYTRTRSTDNDPEEHQRLDNDCQKTVR